MNKTNINVETSSPYDIFNKIIAARLRGGPGKPGTIHPITPTIDNNNPIMLKASFNLISYDYE